MKLLSLALTSVLLLALYGAGRNACAAGYVDAMGQSQWRLNSFLQEAKAKR